MEKKDFYFGILFILLSVFIFFFLLWPKWQSFSLLKNERILKEKELESLNKYIQTLKTNQEKLKDYEVPLSKIDLALPSDPSFPELFNFIQNTCSLKGILLEDIGSIQKTEKDGIKEWKIELTFGGNYPAFKEILYSLENSARLIEVEKISFSSPQKEVFHFKVDLTIRSY